jgi:oxygen-dependent protoporphyrinogen oxidase
MFCMLNPSVPQVVIVGAGISGLALAYQLHRLVPQAKLTILEEQARPGGTIWTERREGFQVEIGPNGFLDSKPSTLSLCQALGLGDRLLAASEQAGRNRYLFLGGKLRLLPNSLASFLTSDVLSWRGKLGVIAERFRAAQQHGVDETIDCFVRRRAGREAAEVLADAFVTGIHAGDPTLLSVRAAFPRLPALEAEFGSVLKGFAAVASRRRAEAAATGQPCERPGRMWSFRDGLRLLVETLRDRLADSLHCGIPVRRLERAGRRPAWLVYDEGRDGWPADAVALACPAPQQAQILADLDAPLSSQVAAIAYNRVAVVGLGYRSADVPSPIDGFGFLTPQRTRRDLLGVQWCSSIFPDRSPPGRVLLRAMCGGWNRPEIVGWDDARLLQAVRVELHATMGITAAPIFHHIVRWEQAIPQYHLGHLDRVAAIEAAAARHAGLFLVGNAYHGIALNDCTEQAEKLALLVQHYLQSLG